MTACARLSRVFFAQLCISSAKLYDVTYVSVTGWAAAVEGRAYADVGAVCAAG